MKSVVTYSPAYTLVPTYECFNRCSYCNFRKDPGQDPWLTLESARLTLETLKSAPNKLSATRPMLINGETQDPSVIEILILSGEVHPQSPRRQQWFQHIYDLCNLALGLGFLPHTNAGPLSWAEMKQLKQVNVSMGLMLEQVTPALLETVHRHAPSKQPELRSQQLAWAGQLQIPFTTGLLIGIGETPQDWEETLSEIATQHRQYGHIQEVILQPHQPGQRQAHGGTPCDDVALLAVVKLARSLLPADITLQIPPNLVQSAEMLIACLESGARDLGGIGPWDEVNPDYPHHGIDQSRTLLRSHGWALEPRLPIYPVYDDWLANSQLKSAVQHWREQLAKGG
ncbi:MAG: 7,8-didemethyl-8-hydroxy-5-deazariboflavin synthase subunit CofG [Cyanobacteria bacterium P01_D01_bin.44]